MNVKKFTSYDETLQRKKVVLLLHKKNSYFLKHFHHDLGKLGDKGNLHYVKNDSD